jgi:hypothetical protein
MTFRLPEDGLLLVDFDGTLLHHCSTELYLDCARPAPLAGTLLWLVDGLKPWRLARHPKAELVWRDWIRVLLVTLLFPWTPWIYRKRVAAMAEAWTNRPLVEALRAAGEHRCAVVTHGFGFIIAPLMAAMDLGAWPLVAAPLLGGALHRRRGKAAAARARLGARALTTATLITDSAGDDADLIATSRPPILVTPPEDWLKPALAGTYRPFAYLEQAKHPGQRHLTRVHLGEDWVVLVLACALASPAPVTLALGLLFLVLAYFIIYEQGYYENDHRATTKEPTPFLSDSQRAWTGAMSAPWAWTFALGFSLPGVALVATVHAIDPRTWVLAPPAALSGWTVTALALLIGWLLLLVVSRFLFALFNRIAPKTRILLFPWLQALKGIGVAWALLLPVSPVGGALLLGQVVSRWLPYAVYRMGGPRWATPDQTVRLLVTLLGALTTLLVVTDGGQPHWSALVILAWCAFKARREIRDLLLG